MCGRRRPFECSWHHRSKLIKDESAGFLLTRDTFRQFLPELDWLLEVLGELVRIFGFCLQLEITG